MGQRDPRVDAYIAAAAPFAQPILRHIRQQVHAACPDVEERIKWGMPFFDHQGPMCHMAAFKAHCALGFWKAELVMGPTPAGEDAMGQFGRITQMADLPTDAQLTAYVHKAMQLNQDGIKAPWLARRKTRPAPVPPEDLIAALQAQPSAHAAFTAFTPGKQREYIDWITEAKTDTTRNKRIATAVEWIAEGKTRYWKNA